MPNTNITLKKSLGLLDAFEMSEFLDKAPLSLRQAAQPFYEAIILHSLWSDEHPLPSKAEMVSAELALAQHQAAIAAGIVHIVPGTPRGPAWLGLIEQQAEDISQKLQREDVPPTEPADASLEPAVGTPECEATRASDTPLRADNAVPPNDTVAIGTNGPKSPEVTSPVWEKPVELAEAHGPDFPIHALPARLRRFVTELAEQVQIPVDVPALASLAMIGAAAAKTVSIEIQPGDEHPSNFWALIVSPPGDGKTPLLAELRRPFDQVQADMRDVDRADSARAATEHRIGQLELQRVEREAAGSDDAETKAELVARAVELRKQLEQRRPGVRTLTTGDCTQLGMSALMDRNSGRLLVLTDEGDQLFSRIQQRSPRGAEDIDDMLKAYSGATIDRHDAHRELRVPGAALSIVATTQPRPFAKVMGVEAYHSKGFIARFALALPRSIQGARKQRRASVSAEARTDYQTLVRGLLEQPIPEAPAKLTLNEEAFQVFADFGAEADREILNNRDASLGAWIGKLRGLAARLAGILHLSDPSNHGINVISRDTMVRAVEVSRYLSAHARVAYEQSERAALDEDPRRLLRWIRDGRRQQFAHAEAVASFSGRLNAREVEACIERLVTARYLRERLAGKSRGGRPRKPSYLVNPWVFQNG